MIGHLTQDNVSLVVIDFQERLLKVMDRAVTERSTFAVNLLLRCFQKWSLPTLVTQQYTAGLGPTHAPIAAYLNEVEIIEKTTFSCCGAPLFNQKLEEAGHKNVVITGMETHICVLQTALDLKARGYQVFVPVDAVLSTRKDRYRNGLALMAAAGAVCVNAESLVFQMMGDCKHEDFRFLQNILKEQYSN